jgi:hypothetical protein
MQDKNLSAKRVLSMILIVIGALGYIAAAYFLCYAVYFWIGGTLHPHTAEDQPHGLDGLGFFLEAVTGLFVAGIASLFFVPGMTLRSRIQTNQKR